MQHVGGHAGVVLVDEAPVGPHKSTIAGCRVGGGEIGAQRVARHDLLEQRARLQANGLIHHGDVLHTLLAEAQQAALLQDGRRQCVAPCHQRLHGDGLTRLDTRHQAEIGGGEEPDVVGVLPVDALETLGNHQPHTGRFFCSRAVFTRRAFAIPLARHHHLDAVGAYRVGADGGAVAGAKTGIRVTPQLFVVMGEDGQRRDFVGRHIVTQRLGLRQGNQLARQAAANHVGRLAQKKNVGCEPQGGTRGWRRSWHALSSRPPLRAAKRQDGTGALAKCAIRANPKKPAPKRHPPAAPRSAPVRSWAGATCGAHTG